jgi:response regulator of citrate/malate metabolism
MIPSLFDIDHTRTRQVESWNTVSTKTQDKQLQMVIGLLKIRPMTSRQLSEYSGIERTSITRVMATHKALFRVENEVIDGKTGKPVTLYQLK